MWGAPADEFLLDIVHDFRALLRQSLAGAQLLERTASPLSPASRKLLEDIVTANKELERFLARLSDYANAAHSSGIGRPIPLEAALQSAVLMFPNKTVEVKTNGAAKNAVPASFVRLFSELIDNAVKFSGSGPVTIFVSGAAVHISVEIADSGIGIEAAEVEHVFGPLVRLNSREQYPGFGLGLSICRRIASETGTSITLASNPTGGMTATVIIPKAPDLS